MGGDGDVYYRHFSTVFQGWGAPRMEAELGRTWAPHTGPPRAYLSGLSQWPLWALGCLWASCPSFLLIESGPADPGPVALGVQLSSQEKRPFPKARRLRRANSIVRKAGAINLSVDCGAPTLSPLCQMSLSRLPLPDPNLPPPRRPPCCPWAVSNLFCPLVPHSSHYPCL